MTRLKDVALLVAGQSPPSEVVNDYAGGFAFLQGNAEFGDSFPAPRLECPSPPKQCAQGDLLISVRAPVGALNRADRAYGIGRGLCAVRPRHVDARFLWWWLLHARPRLQAVAVGSTFEAVTAGVLGALEVSDSCLGEQRVIADYLDRETVRIDALIAKQEDLIRGLRERRQALVERAVLLGLDQQVAMRTSNHPWLPGSIPAGWTVDQLGNRAESLAGLAFSSEGFTHDPSMVRLLRGVNIKPGRVDWSDTVYWDDERDPVPARFQLRLGDLVVGMDRPFVSGGVRVASLGPVDLPAHLLQRVMVLRSDHRGSQDYLAYLLSTRAFLSYLEPLFTGVSVPHMSEWQVRQFRAPFPPRPEQDEIVRHLDDQTSKIDTLVARAERFIELARERRAALITAAVTGQIDVREGVA